MAEVIYYSATALPVNGGREILPLGIPAVHYIVYFSWKEKWPDVKVYIHSWAAGSVLASWSGIWEGQD